VVRTARVVLGTSIVRTWPQHPVALAEETLAIEQLAPGRFRLGIGPTGEAQAVQTYGVNYHEPLTQVREYLIVLCSLLYDGEVDFVGEHVTARARIHTPVRTPLTASAAGLRAFELCGEVSDGAISCMRARRTFGVRGRAPVTTRPRATATRCWRTSWSLVARRR
jgi:alkanesulfonate monooxygenase SsuD/methylene tetrahydromethanopterin reductase-like flavin-dependent oxidoreductase (luciferase family)